MEIYRNINNRMKRARFRNISFRKAALPGLKVFTTQVDDSFFHNKNIVISGEFFPMSESLLKDNLVKREANLQPEMTQDTEILICWKYPDWMLVEEAKLYRIKTIFVDKAGELFREMATDLIEDRSVPMCEEPLGV